MGHPKKVKTANKPAVSAAIPSFEIPNFHFPKSVFGLLFFIEVLLHKERLCRKTAF
jgi:hypothetical protein